MSDLIFAIDTETTGLVPGKHTVVQVGIVRYSYGVAREEIMFRFRPTGEISESALKINGLTASELMLYPTETDLLRESLKGWMTEYELQHIPVLAHNWAFDSAFLRTVLPDYNKYFRRYEDSNALALALQRAGILPEISTSLQSLAEHFGIDSGEAHTAIDDAKTTYAVYRALLGLLDKRTPAMV